MKNQRGQKMLSNRWNELKKNTELAVLLKNQKPVPNPKVVCALDFNGVLVEKDISPKINAMFKEKILLMFDPLRSQTDEQLKTKFEQKGLRIQSDSKKRVIDSLAKLIADECHAPTKGTSARKTVYDLAETALESGEIKIHVYPDTTAFLDRLQNDFVRTLLSRGSVSLLTKSCKGTGLLEHLDEIETTIPYGNAKTAETFIRFVFEQRHKNRAVAEFLEDEFESIQELVLARAWLQKYGQPGFEVVWVDRDNELAEKKRRIQCADPVDETTWSCTGTVFAAG